MIVYDLSCDQGHRFEGWFGSSDDFAEQSRAMHYGEREAETIHGQATPEEAHALFEEGVPVSPLPFPVAPPEDVN